MYKDLISYELAEGINKDHLMRIAKQIVNDWMKKLPGFVKWEIHELATGTFIDIVYWHSAEDAKAAEKMMSDIPNGGDWFACYKPGTIKGQNLFLVGSF